MAAQSSGAVVIRARDRVRKLRNEVRRADRVLAELERAVTDDVWGRYVVRDGAPLDPSELRDFVELAVGENPGRELHIIVIAREGTDPEEP